VDDATLSTNLGPLAIALGDPTGNDKAQAKASYSVDLADSTHDGSATSFSDFFQNVEPNVDQDNHPVDCGFGGSTDLSLSAKLPLSLSPDGGAPFHQLITPAPPDHTNEFDIRLPSQPQGGADTKDIIDPTGSQIDGHDRLEHPKLDDITAALQSQL